MLFISCFSVFMRSCHFFPARVTIVDTSWYVKPIEINLRHMRALSSSQKSLHSILLMQTKTISGKNFSEKVPRAQITSMLTLALLSFVTKLIAIDIDQENIFNHPSTALTHSYRFNVVACCCRKNIVSNASLNRFALCFTTAIRRCHKITWM